MRRFCIGWGEPLIIVNFAKVPKFTINSRFRHARPATIIVYMVLNDICLIIVYHLLCALDTFSTTF